MATHWEEFWSFETKRFTITAATAPDDDLDLSWDDDGSTREGLESGKYVAFMVRVQVALDGNVIAQEYLGGCIYASVREFETGHRDTDAMNRNCSIMRAARGDNVAICHYFPSMVAEAIKNARGAVSRLQSVTLRKVA